MVEPGAVVRDRRADPVRPESRPARKGGRRRIGLTACRLQPGRPVFSNRSWPGPVSHDGAAGAFQDGMVGAAHVRPGRGAGCAVE